MFLSQLLTSQVLTCTVNGCKSNTRRYLVYLIFFVARLDNKWLVQNSSPEINTRIQKKIGPHRCLPHSQTSRQSLGWSWSSHGPDCQILQKKKQFICARLRCAKNSNCWSWENVDHSKVQFFLRSKSQGPLPTPQTIPKSPSEAVCFTFFWAASDLLQSSWCPRIYDFSWENGDATRQQIW